MRNLLPIFLILAASGCRGIVGIDEGHPVNEMDATGSDGAFEDVSDIDGGARDSSALDTTIIDTRADVTTVDSAVASDGSDTTPGTDVSDVDVTPDSGFVSTPGTVDCAGTSCDFRKSEYCCQSGAYSCGAAGISCSGKPQVLCDEYADCVAYGYGTSTVCCADPTTGGVLCLTGCPAPRTQYCMTNAECPSGSCVPTTSGAGKAPHGECSR